MLTKKELEFYEGLIEFDSLIEFRVVCLKELYKGKPILKSFYIRDLEQLQNFYKIYNHKDYIVYYGINTRTKESKLDKDVEYIRMLFFDIEGDKQKFPLTDETYYQKLINTSHYVWQELQKKGLNPNYLGTSGRGLHLLVKIKPILRTSYQKKYELWFKKFIEEIEPNRPHLDIKFSDSMFNPSRIKGAIGFRHNKYEEQPKREILLMHFHENEFATKLNNFDKIINSNFKPKKFVNAKYQRKYDDISFYKSPEWCLIANNRDLPEGELHNKIILLIKILARDNGLNLDKLQMNLIKLGYNDVVDTPNPEDYQYNPFIMFNWCMKYAEYCLKKKIIPPSPYKGKVLVNKLSDFSKCYYIKYIHKLDREIYDFAGIMRYIRDFNRKTATLDNGGRLYIYFDEMWKRIKMNLIGNEFLVEYIEFLKLKDYISCQYKELETEIAKKKIEEYRYM